MTGAIAIFVKTPGLSPVKTRLAACIGQHAAEDWYLAAAGAVAEVARTAAMPVESLIYWAIAECGARWRVCWTGFPQLAQGEGELGARMARVHTYLVEQHGFGVLVGADAPQMDAAEVTVMLQWLASGQPRAALGPARDGGFWLFGSNRAIDPALWNSVTYSRADTLQQFELALAHCGFDWMQAAALSDVDVAADLERCVAEIAALPAALPVQSALAIATQLLIDRVAEQREQREQREQHDAG